MPDLTFTSKGQAEALAAQEAVAKKAREVKDEQDEAAKSVGTWSEGYGKLRSQSESVLKGLQTEQEKIASQIDLINERQAKGIGTTEENVAAVARLRERWIEADEATKKQREDAERVAAAHEKLQASASAAIDSVKTEAEKTAEAISDIETEINSVQEAMDEGLIPKEVGEETIVRLNDKIAALKEPIDQTAAAGNKLGEAVAKSFDPTIIAKWFAGFVGIKAAVGLLKNELEDIQAKADKRIEHFQKPLERAKTLEGEEEAAREATNRARATATAAERAVSVAASQAEQERADRETAIKEKESELEEARKEREEQATKDDAARQKKVVDANRELDFALEDQRESDDPNSRPMTRRVAAARRRVAEAVATPVEGPGVRAADERIAGLQEQIKKMQEERDAPSTVHAAAIDAASEARARVREMEQKQAEAEGRTTEFMGRPEYQQANRIRSRGEVIDKVGEQIMAGGDDSVWSSEELERLADSLRQAGVGSLRRRLRDIVARADDGLVDDEEVRDILREEMLSVRRVQNAPASPQRSGGAMPGGGVVVTPPTAEERDAARRTADAIEKALTVLERMEQNGGSVAGP